MAQLQLCAIALTPTASPSVYFTNVCTATYKMPSPRPVSNANIKNSTPPTICTTFSDMYLLAIAPIDTAISVATACPSVAPAATPTGFDFMARAIVASMERSPHSAMKMSEAVCQNADHHAPPLSFPERSASCSSSSASCSSSSDSWSSASPAASDLTPAQHQMSLSVPFSVLLQAIATLQYWECLVECDEDWERLGNECTDGAVEASYIFQVRACFVFWSSCSTF